MGLQSACRRMGDKDRRIIAWNKVQFLDDDVTQASGLPRIIRAGPLALAPLGTSMQDIVQKWIESRYANIRVLRCVKSRVKVRPWVAAFLISMIQIML
ncbi:hypothetical protein TomMM35A_33790 [Sphingobium sp. TomMM35A]